jgi:hypothetical protein
MTLRFYGYPHPVFKLQDPCVDELETLCCDCVEKCWGDIDETLVLLLSEECSDSYTSATELVFDIDLTISEIEDMLEENGRESEIISPERMSQFKECMQVKRTREIEESEIVGLMIDQWSIGVSHSVRITAPNGEERVIHLSPDDIPSETILDGMKFGARLNRIKTTYDDCFKKCFDISTYRAMNFLMNGLCSDTSLSPAALVNCISDVLFGVGFGVMSYDSESIDFDALPQNVFCLTKCTHNLEYAEETEVLLRERYGFPEYREKQEEDVDLDLDLI